MIAVELLIKALHGQRCRCLYDSSPEILMSSLLVFYVLVSSSDILSSYCATALTTKTLCFMQVVKQ